MHKNATRFNLRAPIFANFSGGMPPDPLKKHASHAKCALHTTVFAPNHIHYEKFFK